MEAYFRHKALQLVINVCHVRHSRLPSMTVELVGKEISWNFGETTATGGLFTRGSVRWKTRNELDS